MAHACLATNRNNASLLLFFSADSPGDSKLWSAWTRSLIEESSSSPVTVYLSADADARAGRLSAAAEKLSLAVTMGRESQSGLACSARGLVRTLQGRWDEALLDFMAPSKLAPGLADVHASLGSYWVLREAPDGAIQAAERALAVNQECALAINVRGCAHLAKGEHGLATDDFALARRLCPLLAVASHNQATMRGFGEKDAVPR